MTHASFRFRLLFSPALFFLVVSGCAHHPGLEESRSAVVDVTRAEFDALGQGAVAPPSPLSRQINTPRTGRVGVAADPVLHPPVADGFSFDTQLQRIRLATESQQREQLIMQYLMQAWNLGPKGFEKAKARLGRLQLTAQ